LSLTALTGLQTSVLRPSIVVQKQVAQMAFYSTALTRF
jgi:hypothetical protein